MNSLITMFVTLNFMMILDFGASYKCYDEKGRNGEALDSEEPCEITIYHALFGAKCIKYFCTNG
uniref:Secreted protein n=1 Tax=Meloidogyne hapla TaxID=6305 RepID=A0A1I8BRK3_MELHA